MGIGINDINDYNRMFADFDFSEVILRRQESGGLSTEYWFAKADQGSQCDHLLDEAERLFADRDECGWRGQCWMMIPVGLPVDDAISFLCPSHVLHVLGRPGDEVARGAVKLHKEESE